MLIGLTLSALGCTTAPPPSNWEMPEYEQSTPVNPKTLPDLCAFVPSESGVGFLLTVPCAQQIERFEIVAEANTTIAQENANALVASQESAMHLITAGATQEEIARVRLERLEEEKKAHFWDNVFHRTIIVLGVIGAVL